MVMRILERQPLKLSSDFAEPPSDDAENKEQKEETRRCSEHADNELVDMFSEYYQPYDLTVLDTVYPHLMRKSCRYVI